MLVDYELLNHSILPILIAINVLYYIEFLSILSILSLTIQAISHSVSVLSNQTTFYQLKLYFIKL